jgi:hypothetical protein
MYFTTAYSYPIVARCPEPLGYFFPEPAAQHTVGSVVNLEIIMKINNFVKIAVICLVTSLFCICWCAILNPEGIFFFSLTAGAAFLIISQGNKT